MTENSGNVNGVCSPFKCVLENPSCCRKKRRIKVKEDLAAKNGKIAIVVCICKIVSENLILPFFVLAPEPRLKRFSPVASSNFLH